MKKVRWGILSTANIGRDKVVPAMQNGEFCEIVAVASRDKVTAATFAQALGIPKAYDTYEALVNEPEVDAIYIPLPNHLHVEWSIKAIQANKHVLCEKPIALSAAQAQELLEASNQKPHLKVMEAFMYRFHPQWQRAKELVDNGSVGELKTVQSFFSYYNTDINNIRNNKEMGGGGLMDIGCYCISLARFIFGKEPSRVIGMVEYDPETSIDRLATGILEFENGSSSFTCSTQLAPYQIVNIAGTTGRIEIEIPFNAPPDKTTRIWLHSAKGKEEISFEPTDQYTLQGDIFSKAILDDTPVPTSLEDAVNNMKVIETVFESARLDSWIKL